MKCANLIYEYRVTNFEANTKLPLIFFITYRGRRGAMRGFLDIFLSTPVKLGICNLKGLFQKQNRGS
jgi:hypothetical protein